MPYCPNCGKEIPSNANFCISCGAQMKPAAAAQPPQQEAPLPPPPPPPPDYVGAEQVGAVQPQPTYPSASGDMEQAVGYMAAKKMKSMGLSYDSYTIVLTTRRMIFAQMTSQMLTQNANNAREQAKSEGKGFFSAWGAQIKANFSYAQRYLQMAPESILAENPGNFAIENNTISQIKVGLKKENPGHSTSYIQDFEIKIQTPMGEYVYRIDDSSNNEKLLKQVYGERVKMPFGYFSKGPVKFKLGI